MSSRFFKPSLLCRTFSSLSSVSSTTAKEPPFNTNHSSTKESPSTQTKEPSFNPDYTIAKDSPPVSSNSASPSPSWPATSNSPNASNPKSFQVKILNKHNCTPHLEGIFLPRPNNDEKARKKQMPKQSTLKPRQTPSD